MNSAALGRLLYRDPVLDIRFAELPLRGSLYSSRPRALDFAHEIFNVRRQDYCVCAD